MLTVAAEELLVEGRPRSLCMQAGGVEALLRAAEALPFSMALEGPERPCLGFDILSRLGAEPGAVSYFGDPEFQHQLAGVRGATIVTSRELLGQVPEDNSTLVVEGATPRDAMYSLFARLLREGAFEKLEGRISPDAQIHPSAVIDDHVVVEAGAMVGANAVLLANTYVGAGCVIKPNATLGGDGFERMEAEGGPRITPHAGGVWLAARSEVGSSTCIDKGLFGEFTYVGESSAIDNLVHVAHGVRVGRRCSIIACSEISGSVFVEDDAWVGPNSSINQGLRVGEGAYIGTGSVVVKDVPAYRLAFGSPAKTAAFVCRCRRKIEFEDGVATCSACGSRYRLSSDEAPRVEPL